MWYVYQGVVGIFGKNVSSASFCRIFSVYFKFIEMFFFYIIDFIILRFASLSRHAYIKRTFGYVFSLTDHSEVDLKFLEIMLFL